ncbi:MFS transporter [Maritimibacter fusiformis]|uniref:MFS transporter n=1 Tax=Maritimibacter fusiformis TaxID=2603819 RepID=A0A5D0RM21_9RHOB|nr:MFS transporter [Maritimibacter fusiformis]TYB82159.1 MFS transporter [Maritimibacter fusiformis]
MLVLGIIMLCIFTAMLSNQIVATALPSIVSSFDGMERFGWVGSAYLLAQATVMPIYGKIGDLIGRKAVLIFALSIFLLGSASCALAWSMESLIAARAFQGLGGGGIIVSAFGVTADIFQPRERARYQSYNSLLLVASASIGPTAGGVLSATLGWRSIFLVTLPLGLIALAGIVALLPRARPGRAVQIDYGGALTLAVAIIGLVLVADSHQIFGSFATWQSVGLFALIAAALVVWVRIERRAQEPVIPLSLFRSRNFSLLLIVAAVSGAVTIGLLNFVALYLQMALGFAPTIAGLFFIVITGGLAVGALAAGRVISATGLYKPLLVAGAILTGVALAGLAGFPVGGPVWVLGAVLLVHGFASGLSQQAPIIGAQYEVSRGHIGAATGAMTLARIGGASLAMSVYSAIVSSGLATVSVPGVAAIDGLSPLALPDLDPAVRDAVEAGFASALRPMFLTAAGLAFASFIAALFLRRVRFEPDRAPSERQIRPE